jgi:hypothetical protein
MGLKLVATGSLVDGEILAVFVHPTLQKMVDAVGRL